MNSKYKSVKENALESMCINKELNKYVKHDFLKTKWRIIQTDDTGNCFFDSLSKFGAITGNHVLNKTHLELRQIVVNTIIQMASSNSPNSENLLTYIFPPGPSGRKLKYETKMDKLYKYLDDGEWYSSIGDAIPQLSSNILDVNINIYDLLSLEPCKFTKYSFTDDFRKTTVNLIRTNQNHYRLLMPVKSTISRSLNNTNIKKTLHTKINTKLNKKFNNYIRKTQKQRKESLKESLKQSLKQSLKPHNTQYKGRITRSRAKELKPELNSSFYNIQH